MTEQDVLDGFSQVLSALEESKRRLDAIEERLERLEQETAWVAGKHRRGGC